MITENIDKAITAADARLNKISSIYKTEVRDLVQELVGKGVVTTGYRTSCGRADNTLKRHREFVKVLGMLKKQGFHITEKSFTEKNAYASINGGFWNTKIYTITKA